MRIQWERLQSALITAAAIAIAVVVVHREFFASPPDAAPSRKPERIVQWQELVAAGRVIGNPNARVKLIEFADLECPFCRSFQSTLREVTTKHPSDVAVVFVHLPLGMHRFARTAAKVAECGAAQGRFSNIVNALYQRQDSFGLRPWAEYARDGGIDDTVAFERCVGDTTTPPMVTKGLAAARKLNFNSTPTLLINDWRFGGVPSDSALFRAVDEVLAGRAPFRD
jgi:protein-disulfide isomerase